MAEKKQVKLTPAKGRPMLTWVGKKPLERVTAFPAQLVEQFNPTGDRRSGGLLFHGDNKDVLAWLLANGFRNQIKLVYIDPPFDSGADYVRKVELRNVKGTVKLDGEEPTLGEQIQYTDMWANDNYLQFMYERLQLLKELLAADGTMYLHCDQRRSHHLRCLLDEIFGSENLIAEVVWKRSDSHNDATYFGIVHDNILVYSKSGDPTFNSLFIPLSQKTADTWYRHIEDGTGRRYNLGNLVSPHPRPNLMYEWRGIPSPAMGWRCSKERMAELDAKGLLVEVGKGDNRTIKVKQYLDESKGRLLSTWWDDISQIRGYGTGDERPDYPTQKPNALLERIIRVSTDPQDIVLDCFAGSGTTATVAQTSGRRWIIADINKGAVQTASKRLQRIIQEQAKAKQKAVLQPALLEAPKEDGLPDPAQLNFSLYRVNDYDLQIQHNEALTLALEHVGVERLKGDAFFDGTLGKRLVKVIPFNHPLTLLDLQLLVDELKTRPNEERDIVLICLGKEIAVTAWLADYNHKHPVNKIEIIELRTDPRYGKFFEHKPAWAEVKIERQGNKIVVEILDFLSPTILERLEIDAGMFKAKITDWRAMVDMILIDVSYDGQVFDIALSDVPERKSDLVSGKYELPAVEGEMLVAVKIIDMLGEEVLVSQSVPAEKI